ncbi:MAG: hypothetical protein WBG81_05250 [Rhodanobacter sp.]|jgi:hypothetical protein|uniref:hypothetical protein n=1 Tax=Rhodanobacter sp. KK11 TaxID=3083255 RepID=UPI002966AEC6|nr:hypothetical protein [Rhodanobacter sp. KK11]MDW2980960.1 hypothetical protein [Rhodanobacter sp. KK11]
MRVWAHIGAGHDDDAVRLRDIADLRGRARRGGHRREIHALPEKTRRGRPGTMRAGMVAAGCAAGFAFLRSVSFRGFLPAFPIIVSTNQKMP